MELFFIEICSNPYWYSFSIADRREMHIRCKKQLASLQATSIS